MSLIERVKKEKVEAFKSKETIKKGIIDTMIGEIDRHPSYRPAVVNGAKEQPDDKVVIETIKKLIKNISSFENETSKEEIEVLESFLPQQMSEPEIESVVSDLIVSTNASSPREMGKVMGAFTKNYNGKADNGLVSQIIKRKLEN